MSGGKKDDKGKTRWDLVPFDIIKEVAEILTGGAEKYGSNNWQGVDTHRYIAATFRHFVAWIGGESLDSESGKSHLSHAITNLIFIRWKEKYGPNKRGIVRTGSEI